MTLMKEKAVEMIQHMPDEHMLYVINILQNLKAISEDREKDKQKAQAALKDILSALNTEKIKSALENEAFEDFEDCLQEECAVEVMADYIVTRNPNDYKKSRIKVVEPGEFIKLL